MSGSSTTEEPAVVVQAVSKHYPTRAGIVRSVDGISLEIAHGEILAVVGESGSGKSTLGKLLVALVRPTGGRVTVHGHDLARLRPGELRRARRHFNIVFQDPGSSINPRMRVAEAIAEPLRIHRLARADHMERRVFELLERVGLPADIAQAFPHQLSGGQRQRVSIARALASGPDLLVADEPTSALDVSVQASILNLFVDLQRELGFTCVFISHNLSAVEYIADRVAVMYLGQIVELAPGADLFAAPYHPYTEVLLDAAPSFELGAASTPKAIVSGAIPSPLNPPPGCRFHTRCPIAIAICKDKNPPLHPAGTSGRSVACHRVDLTGARPPLTHAA